MVSGMREESIRRGEKTVFLDEASKRREAPRWCQTRCPELRHRLEQTSRGLSEQPPTVQRTWASSLGWEGPG